MSLRKIGCDLGNFGVKVVCEDREPFTYEARCVEYDESKYIVGGVKVLTHNGIQLLLGEGDFDYETRKINRTNIKECFVGALAMAADDKDEVVVGVGLPIEQYMTDKEAMKELLSFEGGKVVCSYGLPGEAKEKTIYIKEIVVQPESLATYWAMKKELSERRVSEIIIVDIGGRTTDICTLRKNLDGSITPVGAKTEILGTLKAYEAMASLFTKLSQKMNIDYSFDTEIIEAYVERGYDLGERFEFIDKADSTEKAYRAVASKITRAIKRSNDNYGKALIVISGGGGSKLGKYVQESFQSNSMIVDDIYKNAKGYLEGVNAVYR